MLIAFNGLLRSAYCLNGKTKLTRNSVANHLSLFAPVWHVPSVPVDNRNWHNGARINTLHVFIIRRMDRTVLIDVRDKNFCSLKGDNYLNIKHLRCV